MEGAYDVGAGPYKIDFREDVAVEWHATSGGVERREVEGYRPSVYVVSGSLEDVREVLETHPDVAGLRYVERRPGFRRRRERVLEVDVEAVGRVRGLARQVRSWGKPGEHRLYNVDLSPEFRYCLERELQPHPGRPLDVLEMSAPEGPVRTPVRALDVDGVRHEGAREVVDAVESALERDPDVLVVGSSALLPKLRESARELDFELRLGRDAGLWRRAGSSTYESFGRVCHSPERYNVPGRAVVDRSNTFLYGRTGIHGCLDLVRRSRKPLQEVAWASIGNVLTSIQVCEAAERGVLVPWRSWRHEFFKPMSTLHEADRGGTTFSPDVGVHEDVHEMDFSSLYPNIMVTRNVSPETVLCDCHPGRDDVPGLGYGVCPERGYLPDVLEPLVSDRRMYKDALRWLDGEDVEVDVEALDVDLDDGSRDVLEGRVDALKWILVSCFGYQGFRNAKFGRIECHETINAYAREILLEAKTALEDAGWRVVHGIVDSVWVERRRRDADDPKGVCRRVSDSVDIDLEYEGCFDWLAFVPRREGGGGALNRYFGSRRDGGFKVRGIECRQRSTPAYVEEFQREALEALDLDLSPESVCDVLSRYLSRLRRGEVDVEDLVVRRRVSKEPEEYSRESLAVGACERARDLGVDVHPGEDVGFVVVSESAPRYSGRVRLSFEDVESYDLGFYRRRLVEAAESLVSPFGWRRRDVVDHLEGVEDSSLSAFG